MVQIFSLDVPNTYLGGSIGAIFAFALLWYFLRGQGGRLGEEKQEERETRQLETDERQAETAQIDEKKQCVKMRKIVDQILDTLRSGGMGEIHDKVAGLSGSIGLMLIRMRKEQMNVERALETFKILHGSLNEFASKLPTDNKAINGLVEQLTYYQKNYYKDLIKELMMDRDKKAILKKLWGEFIDEESGSGSAQAA